MKTKILVTMLNATFLVFNYSVFSFPHMLNTLTSFPKETIRVQNSSLFFTFTSKVMWDGFYIRSSCSSSWSRAVGIKGEAICSSHTQCAVVKQGECDHNKHSHLKRWRMGDTQILPVSTNSKISLGRCCLREGSIPWSGLDFTHWE